MTPEEVRTLVDNADSFDATFLGTRTSQLGVEENVSIADDKRLLHTLVVGPTGYGKTQLMVHAALQDAQQGHGLCLINPKGDAIGELLAKLPDDRLDDVVYVDPARGRPPGLNVLEPYTTEGMNDAQVENQKEIIVSDLIDLFERQSENWGDRFGRILETLLRAHLDLNIRYDESNTLVDVFECVVDGDALADLLDRVEDPVVHEQLVRVREDMGSYELEPLQRRLNDFVMNQSIRRVIEAEESSVDLQKAVNEGKIVLVDVQKGEVGETVAQLVGSIVITKVWAAAQSRIAQPRADREPFYLYVDELQNFAGEGSNFTKILSEAREYGLGCWLVTQYLSQLATEMRRAVTNNCRTKVVFNPSGSDDEARLAGMLTGTSKAELKRLGKYRAVVQTPSEGDHSSAVVFDTYPPWEADWDDVDQIKQAQAAETDQRARLSSRQSLGRGANAGGDYHRELLVRATEGLSERGGVQVNLLYQEDGDEKPDGQVILPDGSVAHLEAEHSTLSKPVKVLRNLQRGVEADREVIFVVEEGNAAKLENIVSDPVNRRGDDHEDERGSYSYYTDGDGEPFTAVDTLADAAYRVIEISDDRIEISDSSEIEAECPELDHNEREELQNFCLYRDDDGFCSQLEQPCTLIEQ